MAIVPIIPKPYKLANLRLSGFAVTSAQPGENLWICVKDSVTSENPRFYVYAEQIGNMVFPSLGIAPETVNRSLIIIHPDESAEVYVNNFPESFEMKPTNGLVIRPGTLVYRKDIAEIIKMDFSGIEIRNDDQIVYITREGFRFGIYFNLSRKIDPGEFKQDVGKLKNEIILGDIVNTASRQMAKLDRENYEAYIITEGVTDWKHLVKASEILKEKTSLAYDDSVESRGDSELLKFCEIYSKRELNTKPIICIFDNDNPKIISELQKRTIKGKSYQSWGNNVYSFTIPIPADRASYRNVSIEMFYSDTILKMPDKTGKRLYFSNEIEKTLSMTTKKPSLPKIVSPKLEEEFDKKIEDQDVSQILDTERNNVAISKSVFAEQVFSGERSLSKDDFKNFQSIFTIIGEIITNSKQS